MGRRPGAAAQTVARGPREQRLRWSVVGRRCLSLECQGSWGWVLAGRHDGLGVDCWMACGVSDRLESLGEPDLTGASLERSDEERFLRQGIVGHPAEERACLVVVGHAGSSVAGEA